MSHGVAGSRAESADPGGTGDSEDPGDPPLGDAPGTSGVPRWFPQRETDTGRGPAAAVDAARQLKLDRARVRGLSRDTHTLRVRAIQASEARAWGAGW